MPEPFGISRTTGQKWLARYRSGGAAALADQSRRPGHCPRQSPAAVEAAVLALRAAHPTWGGRKLRRRLQVGGEPAVPAASTITAILRRHGHLAAPGGAGPAPWQPFTAPGPNELWPIDVPGHFPLQVGRCHPLPVLDDHSRFLLGLRACPDERAATVHAALTALFRRSGLPWRLLCDNGPPWGAYQDGGRLTTLGAWLIRLGVTVVHGRPFHPQTQGKLERANRTLAADVLAGGRFTTLAAAQDAFAAWRHTDNQERPHEALGLATPATAYRPSPRAFPETLPPIVDEPGDEVRSVGADGRIHWQGRRWRVSHALARQPVALRPTATDGLLEVRYCHQVVRQIDLRADEPED